MTQMPDTEQSLHRVRAESTGSRMSGHKYKIFGSYEFFEIPLFLLQG